MWVYHFNEHLLSPRHHQRSSIHAVNIITAHIDPANLLPYHQGISILADLWHAPSTKQAIGTATTGSSEAIQLGGLAMKKIWQEKRKAAGKSIHEPGSAPIYLHRLRLTYDVY